MSTEEDREALRAAFMAGRRERIRARAEWANDETETMPYPTGDEDEYMADAILAAGFHRTPAPAPDVRELIEYARMYSSPESPLLSDDLILRLADALEAVAHSDYHEGLEEGIKVGRAEEVSTPQVTYEMVIQAVGAYEDDSDERVYWRPMRAALEAALGVNGR